MSEYRLVFAKEGRAVWISHLDLLRTFQRAFIRAGMVIKHSQGFHPHPILSFVLPLSVGQASGCVLLDFATQEDIPGDEIVRRLTPCLPEGIRALACQAPVKPVRELDALQAEVRLTYDGGIPQGAGEKICALLLGEHVAVEKRNKKKQMVDTDIRPMIRAVSAQEDDRDLLLSVTVQAQNPGVNPALLAAAVERHLPPLRPDAVQVRRTAMLDGTGKLFR